MITAKGCEIRPLQSPDGHPQTQSLVDAALLLGIESCCVISASFACHREKTSPPLRSPPFKSARLFGVQKPLGKKGRLELITIPFPSLKSNMRETGCLGRPFALQIDAKAGYFFGSPRPSIMT